MFLSVDLDSQRILKKSPQILSNPGASLTHEHGRASTDRACGGEYDCTRHHRPPAPRARACVWSVRHFINSLSVTNDDAYPPYGVGTLGCLLLGWDPTLTHTIWECHCTGYPYLEISHGRDSKNLLGKRNWTMENAPWCGSPHQPSSHGPQPRPLHHLRNGRLPRATSTAPRATQTDGCRRRQGTTA